MQEGTEGTGSVQETDESVETEVTEIPEQPEPKSKDEIEYIPNESAKETAERVSRTLKGEEGPGSKGTGKQEGTKEPNGETTQDADRIKNEDFDPELSPPERLKAHEKQMFNNLPKGLKRAYNRSIKELEGSTTKDKQELQRYAHEARSVVEAVTPFASKWGEQGFTVPQAIASLAAAHEKLTDPNTAVETYIRLGRDIGIDFEALPQIVRGEVAAKGPDIAQHPQFQALNNELQQLRSAIEPIYSNHTQQQAQQFQGLVAQITGEISAVRDEIDPATGNYRYPKLHDEEYLAERVRPLVSALVSNAAGSLSYGEATKRAYAALEGIPYQATTQANQIRPTATQHNNTQQRAASAAVSVRGKSAPSAGTGFSMPDKIPNSTRDTALLAAEMIRRGQG